MVKHGQKERLTICFSSTSFELLMEIKRRSNYSISYIVDKAILRAYQSPLQFLQDQKRQLIKRINVLDREIKDIVGDEVDTIKKVVDVDKRERQDENLEKG